MKHFRGCTGQRHTDCQIGKEKYALRSPETVLIPNNIGPAPSRFFIGKLQEGFGEIGKQPKETNLRLAEDYWNPEGALAPEGFQ